MFSRCLSISETPKNPANKKCAMPEGSGHGAEVTPKYYHTTEE